MYRVLVIEDEASERSPLKQILEKHQLKVEQAGSINQAIEDYPLASFNLIITDLRLPGQSGTDIIQLAQGVPVLVMTSYASLRSAVDAMKLGAVDYIAKPFDETDIIESVQNILKKQANTFEKSEQRSRVQQISDLIYGRCQAMRKVFGLINKVAPTDANVLIQGETGSGKELAAKAIHQLSLRQHNAIICLNCAAIPESLIESELFGHEKGAFTGAAAARTGLVEAADGGTLFLDEIGELPLDAQARLLRVLQESEIRRVGSTQSKKVDFRLIAATHRNLKELCRTGHFRQDLYYRLNVVQIRIPALRARGNDIMGLAERLLKSSSEKLNRSGLTFSPDAIRALRAHSWPGNVRELENVIERGIILCESNVISTELLDIEEELHVNALFDEASMLETSNLIGTHVKNLSIEDYFQQFVLENQHHMSETELAQNLGISRKSLWERRQKLGIPRKKKA
jgi:DNA-binding NtrC family response regulator